ncbi:MAG TPA: LLM class flavin-dependent oxidoreductase [candidate division Zixibacteria bacterium]|nr:LLM class flavin-dependent oxidoreductase [candidate division Zixibacteria bacterium]
MKVGLSPLQGQESFEETLRECERAEEAGFDSVWLGEHHNNPVLYPAPLLGLAALAARTRRLRLGTGVLLLPLYHPLAVAEEGALVDRISAGRLILGVGAGYAPEEFAAFGLSLAERRGRMDEGAMLLGRLWTEEKVTFRGKHYRVENATVTPRPLQRPRPPIWFGAWTEAALRRAARFGDAWLAGPSAALGELSPCARLYREACAENGRGAGEVALFRYVFVAESASEAAALAGKGFLRAFESMYFRWPHPVVKRPEGKIDIGRLAEDRIVIGDPDTCLSTIRRFARELGVGHLICRFSVPGISREACRRSLDLFASELLPALHACAT